MARRLILALMIATLGVGAVAPVAVAAAPKGSVRVAEFTRPARAPLGFQMFCLKHRDQCRPSNVAAITLTQEIYDALNSVNNSVNRAIRPQNDVGMDTWTLNPRAGDCEDYVVTKRARLIAMGIPAGALRIAATTYQGQGHAILVVRTNEGDLVLDNMRNGIRTLQQSGYRLTMMSSPNPARWFS